MATSAAAAATSAAPTPATRSHLRFVLNGTPVVVDDVDPRTTVLEYVRSKSQRLTGTKLGCGEGGCGACTVLVTRFEEGETEPRHRSINACLAPLCSVDGAHVTTIEGIGSPANPHPAQERIAKLHGSQCGFCTPGIVMSLYSKLANNPTPTVADIEDTFDGNLCRCTGYRPILDAAKTFAVDAPLGACGTCPNREHCLPARSATAEVVVSNTCSKVTAPRPEEQWSVAFDPTGAHAPPTLSAEYRDVAREAIEITKTLDDGSVVAWHRPASLEGLAGIKTAHPDAKFIVGNTEVGIESKILGRKYTTLVSVAAVPEVNRIELAADKLSIVVGSGVTISALQTEIERKYASPEGARFAEPTTLAAIRRILTWFASTAIRNGASIGGNVCTASPIGDLMPILMASGAVFEVCGLNPETGALSTRDVAAADWLLGYRKTALLGHELLRAVRIPITPAAVVDATSTVVSVANAFKQSRRRDDDISILTGAFTAEVAMNTPAGAPSPTACVIRKCTIAFGGVAPMTILCPKIAEALIGASLPLDEATRAKIRDAVAAQFTLAPNVPGGMPAFRMTTAASMVERFALDTERFVLKTGPVDGADSYITTHKPVSSGVQQYTRDPEGGNLHTNEPTPLSPSAKTRRGAYGEAIAHQSALLQTTGRAQYVDDIPEIDGSLFAYPVLSDRPTGKFTLGNLDVVRSMPGVSAVITVSDLRGQNVTGIVPPFDEQLFRESEVTAAGQLIALVVADSQERAVNAAKAVPVEYAADAPTPVITIAQAIAAGTINPIQHVLEQGDVASILASAADKGLVVVEGSVRMNGAEHFYLETAGAIAIPKDDGAELEVIGSTQGNHLAQVFVSRATGIPMHKVVCKAKRLGGGFGGKESRVSWIAAAAAVGAQLTRRPVRFMLDRHTDMLTQGTRHPFVGHYKLAADPKSGKIVAFDVDLYSNGGYAKDLSIAVMDRALFHCTNAYMIPNVAARGHVCITNTANNTAFRGFGAPQGMLVIEQAIEALAAKMKVDPGTLRSDNFILDGELTHYNQKVACNPIPRLWKDLHSAQHGDIARRQADIDAFNATHKHVKRGLNALPTIFGISFTAQFMNQGGCTVHVYTDGTVRASHGGVEMGQGVHTKVIQLIASALCIPHERVFIAETSTELVPNASPTAASASFDLYGAAALDACEQLCARLKPFLPDNWHTKDVPEADRTALFNKAVFSAYMNRVDLCAHGFYVTDAGFDFEKPVAHRGMPFAYFTTGVACSEVEVDLLSGDMRVMRADILMDLGISPNPAIDIGQVEGAYVQGMGYYTLEETVWGSPDEHRWLRPGQCFTRGPGNYKIPAFNDVPVDMRVTLLAEAPNPRAVHSSKAVGEPPLFLGATAAFAARNAIRASVRDNGGDEAALFAALDTPLSAERLRMLAGDATAKFFTKSVVDAGGDAQPALFC